MSQTPSKNSKQSTSTRLQQNFECEHPVALVTGSGAPRVGRVIARQLAEQGCSIALHANTNVVAARKTAETWQSELGVEVFVVQGDLEHDDACQQMVSDTHEHFGRLDILVNSAAIWEPTKLAEITGDEVRRYFQINAVAPLLCTRAAGRVMCQQKLGGCVVNLGDWATVRPYAEHAAYFPSKGAVEVMTRSLAVELAANNERVRVNCVQPGPVLLGENVPAETVAELSASTLVGRIGTPEDVAQAVVFLCENTFVTGVCLPVDGGRSIYAPDGLQLGRNTG